MCGWFDNMVTYSPCRPEPVPSGTGCCFHKHSDLTSVPRVSSAGPEEQESQNHWEFMRLRSISDISLFVVCFTCTVSVNSISFILLYINFALEDKKPLTSVFQICRLVM